LPDRLPYRVTRTSPSADLAWCVDLFWTSAWDVADGRAVTARILPHPTVNLTLTFGMGHLIITGVAAGVFTRTLTGRDSVFGIKLRPGVAHLLTETPIRTIDGFGQRADPMLAGASQLTEALIAAGTTPARIAVAEVFLRGLQLRPNPELIMVQQAVDALVGDAGIRRVSDLTARLGVSDRTLQRLFGSYLGVPPGWVLRRGRLHKAAERLIQAAAGGSEALAEIAAEFGYADQAHFTHDFRRILGVPPSSWMSQLVTEHQLD
jgi:AraC-like DNA-binding protein